MRRTLILFLVFQLLLACSERPLVPQPETAAAPADFPADPFKGEAGTRFKVVPTESLLEVRVFRGGKLARFGHNHVISSTGVGGVVLLAEQLANSKAQLYLPLASLVVDDPQLRQAAGDGFDYELSAEDRQGTRANMLGERQLNASEHPFIYIEVLGLQQSPQGWLARLQMTILDQPVSKTVPIEFTESACELTINSQFELHHAELGFEAFTALGGALQVKDPLQLAVKLATRSSLANCKE